MIYTKEVENMCPQFFWNEFHSITQLVYEPEGFSNRPVEDVAPVAITKQAFASFKQAVFILTVVVECIRIIDLHQNFQESFYFSFLHVPVFYLLL